MSKKVCNTDCLNCQFDDCINTEDATLKEREFLAEYETSVKKEREMKVDPTLGMTRYIHNRPDKEAYIKARNREYEEKRKGRADRVEYKRQQYLRHREDKLAYANKYYLEHREEVLAKRKALYEAHKDEINRKRREDYRKRKEQEKCKLQLATTSA